MGQTFSALGTQDPRQDAHGQIDFRLQRQLRGYSRADPPPNRVKPIPIQILQHVMALAALASAAHGTKAIADMICLAFFFLLRPGEYTGTPSETTPFTLQDVQCWIGHQRYLATTIPVADLTRVTFVTLTCTTQKNGVRGEVIGLGRSGNPHLCPVAALTRRIAHLRNHNAPVHVPLASYYTTDNAPQPSLIKPAPITTALRASTAIIGPSVGFLPADVSARSLRATGAMELLCAHVDTDVIRLLGRWRSDEMLRYFHVQAAQNPSCAYSLAACCPEAFTLVPNQDVPIL
jgi:hypothetical protein